MINKEQRRVKIKEQLGREIAPISAQGYSHMSVEDKKVFKEVIAENGGDYEEYMKKARRSWPAVTNPKPIKWRDGRDGSYL